jgi:hypothetical protein
MKKIAQNRDETSFCTDEGAILREEGTILTKVDTSTNDVTTAKGGPVSVPCLFGREGVAVITMVAPGVFLPPWKLVETSVSGSKPNTYVSFLCLAQNFDFVVIDTACGGYGVISTDHTGIVGGTTILEVSSMVGEFFAVRRNA